MTAFSRAEGKQTGKSHWQVEIRSLNHRYFDFSAKLPSEYLAFESEIRDYVKTKIARGKIYLNISKESEGDDEMLELDESAVERYLASVRKLERKYKVKNNLTTGDVIGLPKLFKYRKRKTNTSKSWDDLKRILSKALVQTITAKEVEGKKIAKDITSRLATIGKTVVQMETKIRGQKNKHFDRLKKRLSELLSDQSFDEERLWREVAYLSERSDVTEEIVRLRGHLQLFKDKLKAKGDVGREMDFLCQEMHREINTLGSKAQVLEVSQSVISVKGEIEKIREQVQNIE